ncbi:MAG: beta-hydroxyacyl-ACP dehydratase [Catenulispora sp.]|nr:beta-hydroxyacyl-ACP dehydratase [Catenulispora sp.]
MLDIPAIHRLLPHRFPMLLIDRVTEMVPGERVVAVKAVTVNEPCYGSVPDGSPARAYRYPPALLVESWCQAAAVLAAWEAPRAEDGSPAGVALFGGASDVAFDGDVHPGELLEHRVRLTRTVGENWLFEGESTSAGRPVLRIGQLITALRSMDVLRPAPAGPA